jgi:prophage regulatory protein
MPRELPNRFNSLLRVPSSRASSARRPAADGSASRQPETTGGNNGSSADLPPARLLRFPTVRERTGLSRSTIWRLERRGEFPRHRRISANVVAWVEHEVTEWIQTRTQSRLA